jgi:hypothetical protein
MHASRLPLLAGLAACLALCGCGGGVVKEPPACPAPVADAVADFRFMAVWARP